MTPTPPAAPAPGRGALGLAAAATLLVAMVVVALSVGRFPVAPADLVEVAWARLSGRRAAVERTVATVLFAVRAPRVAAALLVGAALATAGAAYQGLFRNPLVSPDILGVSSGAALGAVAGIYLSLGVPAIQTLAFLTGLGAVLVVWTLASAFRTHDPILILVLAGLVVGALAGAGVSLLKYLADPYNQLPAITFWLLGSLAAVGPGDVAAALPTALVGLVLLWLPRWRLNVMSLGEDESRALGVDTRQVRALVVTGATLATSAVVSVSGTIGWIGLLVPHVARLLAGPDFTRLLPAAALLGAGFLLGVDTLARTIAPVEVPLGVLTALAGAPFFVWLLPRARRGWA